MRLYTHLFLGRTCEAPGCRVECCGIYLTNEGRNAVRACCEKHAERAEQHFRTLDQPATARRAA